MSGSLTVKGVSTEFGSYCTLGTFIEFYVFVV